MNGISDRRRTEIRAPNLYFQLLEGRAPAELAGTLAAWPMLTRLPGGDGHPVLVLPGLIATDASTAVLRRYLRALGYRAQRWGLGRNLGFRSALMAACAQRVEHLHADTGRTVSLIGWSLGGLYARQLAKQLPHAVRQVITLGTPFTGDIRASNARRVYEWLNGRATDPALLASIATAPPVPTTSIYSRTDGIVPWRCSVMEEGPRADNIEVKASHTGMGANPAVLYAIADRLAQPEHDWRPFRRTGLRRLVYSSLASATA